MRFSEDENIISRRLSDRTNARHLLSHCWSNEIRSEKDARGLSFDGGLYRKVGHMHIDAFANTIKDSPRADPATKVNQRDISTLCRVDGTKSKDLSVPTSKHVKGCRK